MRPQTIARVTSRLPFSVSVAGRRRDLLLRAMDGAFRTRLICGPVTTPVGPLFLDVNHDPERLLAYFSGNVFRSYQRSPLGRYIRGSAGVGRTFVDVGANLGMYSLVARSVGMASVAIEPEPSHGRFLGRNISTFGRVIQEALSVEDGRSSLFYERANAGATSLLPSAGYFEGASTVVVGTFSGLAARGMLGNLAGISLVKIDVEGLEYSVVQGMEEFLSQGHRPAIWCEVRGDASGRNGGSFRFVRAKLESLGYQSRVPEVPTRLEQPTDSELASRGVFDMVFEASGSS